MKKIISIFFFLSLAITSVGQINFYQQTCQCGVTGAGFSTATGSGSGAFDIFIEPGSTIKKAWLFAHRFGLSPDTIININAVPFMFNESNRINPITFSTPTTGNEPESVHAIDVTNFINPAVTNYTIDIPFQNFDCLPCMYGCVYLYVLYENPAFTNFISSTILINDKNEESIVPYNFSNIQPITSNSPLGFAVYLDRMNSFQPNDGSRLKFNGVDVGLMQGTDNVNSAFSGGATKGHFYFQNNQLFGLDDDTPDFVVGGSDGLLDATAFRIGNSLNWALEYELLTQFGYNIYSGFFLEHSTPCIPFDVTVTPDTTICKNTPFQLLATGGVEYLWQPTEDLSCTDCPNPIFTGDSSRLYTVQIWNNDTCSVVRPVKINVRDLPEFSSIGITPTLCGTQSGILTLVAIQNAVLPLSYALDNGAFQNTSSYTKVFNGLDSGFVTVHLKDANGCVRDSVVIIGVNNPTQAQFSANPLTGAAPLAVNVNNLSVSATNYIWYLNDQLQDDSFHNFIADTSGLYEIELIAWQNDPLCADTFLLTVSVYDSLIIQVPNIFTPDDDGINDVFGISSNFPITIDYFILNRWGNVVKEGTVSWSQNLVNDFYELWNGKDATTGVYFYQLEINAVPAEGMGIDESVSNQFPIRKEGYFQLVK